MRRVLILPGYSEKNLKWLEETQRHLKSDEFEVIAHPWSHWDGGEFELTNELQLLSEKIKEETTCIIAKSVGTRVAVEILAKRLFPVEKLILCGIPYHWQPDSGEPIPEHYREALTDFPSRNILCIQNSKDPYATYESIKNLLSSINEKMRIVSKETDTHDYPYYEDFSSFLSS